jgi:phage major head subunit gpT-like protein
VVNEDFENTIAVPGNCIEDDSYGQFLPLMGAMGADAEEIWMKLAIQVLTDNPTWADANPFFCSGRPIGDSTITNCVTTTFSATAMEAGLTAMAGWTLAGGEPAGVTPRYLMVGPSLQSSAVGVLESDMVNVGGVPVSNVNKGVLELKVSNRLVGTHAGKWFILGEKGGIQPIAVQQRKKGVLTRMDTASDEVVFTRNEYRYGTHARGESFGVMPFLAYAGGYGSVPAFA